MNKFANAGPAIEADADQGQEAPAVDMAPADLAAESMLGDLSALIIDELKAAPDVWAKMSQHKQDDVIDRVTKRVGAAIVEAVKMIASEGREVIAADLESITAKDGIKAILTLPKSSPSRHALLDAVGLPVLIVVAGAKQFLNGELPKSDPTQTELPIDKLQLQRDLDAANDAPVADAGQGFGAEFVASTEPGYGLAGGAG